MRKIVQRYRVSVYVILPALVGLWLYWPTLSLPLIYDTLLHIRISDGLNWQTVWLPAEAFGFYRPLTFLPFLLVEAAFDAYPAWLLHGMNVVQHALNASLLVWLCWRLWRNGRLAFLAGLLFILFPFSYQAVAVYGHNVHPTTVGLILAGLLSYLWAREAKQSLPWLLVGFFFLLSLLSHESAILFGGFAALVEWNRPNSKSPIPNLQPKVEQSPWLIFLLLGILYLIGYQFLPITRPPNAGTLNLQSLGARGLYLLQAAVYPLAWLGQRLLPNNGLWIVGGATAVSLLWAAWAARIQKNRLRLLLGIGWLGAAYLLIAIPLSTTYLLHGPRLLYLGSVGVSIVWAILLDSLFGAVKTDNTKQSLRTLGATAVTLAILIPSTVFVNGRLRAYRQLTQPLEVVAEAMADRPQHAGIVMANLPQWLDSAQNSYPVGVEFVSMLGDYLFIEELINDNLQNSHPARAIKLPEQLVTTTYHYAVHEQSRFEEIDFGLPEQHFFLTSYAEDKPETVYSGWIGEKETVGQPLAEFAVYDLLDATANYCDGKSEVVLTWREGGKRPLATTSIFLHILDSHSQLISQADGPPLGLQPDTIPIEKDRVIVDIRHIATPDQEPTRLLIGVYNYLNGERYPATDAEGAALQDGAFSLPINYRCQ